MAIQNPNNKRLGEIYVELSKLNHRWQVIEAAYTEKIWSDQRLIADQGYSPMSNQAEKLRGAKLQLHLAADQEYQDILVQIAVLEGERIALGGEFDTDSLIL
ncbi:hypothetical protein ACFLWO_00930 [Chloroflexota bacterium]